MELTCVGLGQWSEWTLGRGVQSFYRLRILISYSLFNGFQWLFFTKSVLRAITKFMYYVGYTLNLPYI